MRPVAASLLVSTGLIAGVTAATRSEVLPRRDFVASPDVLMTGRAWLLATSALVADRPALPSILGFLLVGSVAGAVAGMRVVWLAALVGHVGSAVLVYGGVLFAHVFWPTAVTPVLLLPDYGTSAIIAAWIGVIAYRWWAGVGHRLRRLGPAALCVLSGFIGWLLKSDLTVLDTEHAVALALGIWVARAKWPLAASGWLTIIPERAVSSKLKLERPSSLSGPSRTPEMATVAVSREP